MRKKLYNSRTLLIKAAALIFTLIFASVIPAGCVRAGQKYLFTLNFAFIFDNNTGLFANASQEYKYSDKTFFSINKNKPDYKTGISKDYSIPAEYTASGSEIKFTVGYIIEGGKLCIAPPLLYGNTFDAAYVLPDNKSAVFVFGHADVFKINVVEDKIEPVFDKKDFANASLPEDADLLNDKTYSNFVLADIVSISPDGQYMLYKSNRLDFFYAGRFDLYVKNLVSGEDSLIMDFNKKDFISWNKEEEASFLYREDITESAVSGKKYSEIFKYSLTGKKSGIFWNMKEKFRGYEPIDGTYLYIHSDRVFDVVNYYNKDLIFIDTGMYSTLSGVKLSLDNEYAVMFASHTNVDGKLITEVISIHLNTNNTISHTESSVKTFVVDSYHFGKRNSENVLVINYFDTSKLTYKSEFYIIDHSHVVPEFKKNLGNADED